MGKRYAFSDIHGNFDLLKQILKFCNYDDELYFLGDAIDRGPEGILCMQYLLNDPRVTYLMGNHENMFIKSYQEKFGRAFDEIVDIYNSSTMLWMQNGGDSTKYKFNELSTQEQDSLYSKIINLPNRISFENKNNKLIVLSHAGTSIYNFIDNDNKKFNWLWDRKHIDEEYIEDKDIKDIYLVHGHTPVCSHYFQESKMKPRVVEYCDRHKIDIDMGSFVTNEIALVDLDSIGSEELSINKIYN